jgi:hypothetical protein
VAELGDSEAPLPSRPGAGEIPMETAEPPGRAGLLAALRASVELSASNGAAGPSEVPAAAGRTRRKR